MEFSPLNGNLLALSSHDGNIHIHSVQQNGVQVVTQPKSAQERQQPVFHISWMAVSG